jgi:hypothetical protein
MSELNQDYLDYKSFYEKHKSKNLDAIIEDMNNINESCLNKSFIYILLWQKWIDEPETVSYYLYDQTSNQNKNEYVKRNYVTSFNDFKLIPYNETGKDILPIIDLRKIFKAINIGKRSELLESIYNKIDSNLNNKKNKKRVDTYIDQEWGSMQKTLYGLYIDLLSILDYTPNNYLFDLKLIGNTQNIDFPNIIKNNFTFKEKESVITEKINYINSIKHPIDNAFSEYDVLENINSTFNKIIKILRSIIGYIDTVNEKLKDEKETVEKINISNILNLKSESNVPLDRLIEIVKPVMRPIFKKSYIARENNLYGYVKIKLIKKVNKGKTVDQDGNFIEIDNFNIPYNNIINFEYDVNDQKAILSLVDVDGNISELLINKMYSFFNSNSDYVKNLNQNSESAEYFQIEYGWAGPQTEDDDEMMQNGLYMKKNFNGYIKSITSQFTQKGAEYAIEIKPNNFKKIYNNPMNSYEILYSEENDRDSFIMAIIKLFLLLKYVKETYATNKSIDYKSAPLYANFLEKFFANIIEGRSSRAPFYIKPIFNNRKQIISYVIAIEKNIGTVKNLKATTEEIVTEEITKANNIDDFNLIELLISDVQPDEFEKNKIYYMTKIKIKDFSNIKAHFEKETYSLNGWIVAVLIILTIKKYYLENNKNFILHDITGLFDFFNEEYKNNTTEYILNEKMRKIIAKFNPFCLKEKIVDNDNIDVYLFKGIKKSFENNYNKYRLYDLVPYINQEEEKKSIEKFQNIAFFSRKLEEIFISIKNLGLNEKVNTKEIFNISDKISVNYMSHEFSKKQDVDFKYKQIIYSNKDIIYATDEIVNQKIEDYSYNIFKKNLNALTNQDGITVMFLSYSLSLDRLFKNQNYSIIYKLGFLTKLIAQSYSLMPSIKPKTRNSNKQFFSQGNDNLLRERSGDILEFEIEKLDIQKTVGLIISNKNQKNIGFNDFSSNSFVDGLTENAAKYYNTYIDINGMPDKQKIARDMATLQSNYRNGTQLKGSITIFGEPYWSDINLLRNKYINITINYNSGRLSSHSGLYMVVNATHTINNGKYTTKLEIIRQYTFLDNFTIKGDINTFLM